GGARRSSPWVRAPCRLWNVGCPWRGPTRARLRGQAVRSNALLPDRRHGIFMIAAYIESRSRPSFRPRMYRRERGRERSGPAGRKGGGLFFFLNQKFRGLKAAKNRHGTISVVSPRGNTRAHPPSHPPPGAARRYSGFPAGVKAGRVPRSPPPGGGARAVPIRKGITAARELAWRKSAHGFTLHLGGRGRALLEVVPDGTYPGMWRVAMPDGR